MNIAPALTHLFDQINSLLHALDNHQYTQPCPTLHHATVGQHIRHTLDFFACLIQGQQQGLVNYDSRERNERIESERMTAIHQTDELKKASLLLSTHQQLVLEVCYGTSDKASMQIPSNVGRELVYAIEHAVHHLALIKIGIREIAPNLSLPDGFGVASSTIRYRQDTAKTQS
jgi:uncharacterized damage-inducible protein DinB